MLLLDADASIAHGKYRKVVVQVPVNKNLAAFMACVANSVTHQVTKCALQLVLRAA